MTPAEVAKALAVGDVSSVRSAMDDDTRQGIPEDRMRSVWNELVGALGPMQSVGDGVVVHDVPLKLERGDAHLQVAYRSGRIAGLVVKQGMPTGRFGE